MKLMDDGAWPGARSCGSGSPHEENRLRLAASLSRVSSPAMDHCSDELLMARYQKGDVASFAQLVERYERRIWVFLRRYVGEPATADDLLQEVFLRVVRAASTWNAEAKVSTWLYTIARNLCTDHARWARHRRADSLDAPSASESSGLLLVDRLASQDPGTDAKAQGRELIARLDAALLQLPEDQREVFVLRETVGMPFDEIAKTVGSSVSTVKSRMRYALTRLRDLLEDFQPNRNSPPKTGATS